MVAETAYERIIGRLRAHGCKVIEKGGSRADSTCPAHEDRNPSLSVTGIPGQTLVYCHGECHWRDVLAAIELTPADLYDEKSETYRYTDGRTVKRFYDERGKKRFVQTGAGPTSTLYHLGELQTVEPGSVAVFIVEGEKDVHAIESQGGVATTAPQGAGSFHKVDASPLAGHKVNVVVDRDDAGAKWAAQVAAKLTGVVAGIRYYNAKEGKDAADHIAAGHGLGDFERVPAPDVEPEPADDEERAQYPRLVADELERLRIRRDAAHMLRAEERPKAEKAEWLPLGELLALPPQETSWRIEDWMPTDARIVLAAQRKAGKTTSVGNLMRSLVDGDPWLGIATAEPITGNVVLLDFEMSQSKLTEWLRDQKIGDPSRLIVVPMRGKGGGFDITDDRTRGQWAAQLRDANCGYVILDCLRPVMDALGLDEDKQAGRFLTAFDALLNEAGVGEATVVHHMGHNGERSRGDSRLRDWPDVEWKIVRKDPDDDASPRFISAYGRDVDQREQLLGYDAITRRLLSLGGTRKESSAAEHIPYVVGLLAAHPHLNAVPAAWFEKTAAKDDASPGRNQVREAVKLAAKNGALFATQGEKNATNYRLPIRAGQRPNSPVRQ
jgi:5S rRNA maturation endonuclease (ribonuclease M5)